MPGIQLCDCQGCAHPAEVVLVVVAVNVVDDVEGDPVKRALCPEHAAMVLYLVREAGAV